MSDIQPDAQFWNFADSFIHLANKHVAKAPSTRVSATLLYAAARFNAFVATANSSSKEEFAADKEEVVAYFREQYEKMLRENLADYEANYDKYIR